MKIFKKLKLSKGMKILRIVEIVIVLFFTGYIVITFIPQTKELFNQMKETKEQNKDAIQ